MNETSANPLFVEKFIVSFIAFILTIFGLLGYIIVCTIFIKYKKTDFKNPFYQLALALAFSDCTHLIFTTFIVNVPLVMSKTYATIFPSALYSVMFSVIAWNYYSMYAMIAIISINRYISIAHYYNYRNICRKFRINLAILCAFLLGSSILLVQSVAKCWFTFSIYSTAWMCESFTDRKVMLFFIYAAAFPALCSLIVCIFYVISYLAHRKLLSQGPIHSGLKREWALMFQFFLISFCALVMVIIYWAFAFVTPKNTNEAVMIVLGCINSSINPYCYIFFNSSVKKHLPNWMKLIFTGQTNHVETANFVAFAL